MVRARGFGAVLGDMKGAGGTGDAKGAEGFGDSGIWGFGDMEPCWLYSAETLERRCRYGGRELVSRPPRLGNKPAGVARDGRVPPA